MSWQTAVALRIGRWVAVGSALTLSGVTLAEEVVSSATVADVIVDQDGADGEVDEYPITEADRDHWSFLPITRPTLPDWVGRATESIDSDWPRNEVDVWILEELRARSMTPSDEADRATLLRRLKFDLLGLPPTAEEVADFEIDRRSDAYERLVDRLLASPDYGRRWAQHWLDLARFAETDGFEHDKTRAEAWRYRQWVIDALNQDLPYDRFVSLQLAGDLTGDPADAVATHFCLAGPDMPDINEQTLRRHDKLNEIAATVGAALLGLQVQCAQCHDHKYDPVSQADFFRLRAIFESSVPEMKRDRAVDRLAAGAAMSEPRLYHRGQLDRPGPVVRPAPPRVVSPVGVPTGFEPQAGATAGEIGAEPRAAFTRWLFRDDNPLPARVIANRIWQHHFGASLCGNPSDFGLIADGPSHPELLEYLAAELRDSGWSLKRMHRLLVTSATYRQAGFDRAGSGSEDEETAFARSVRLDPGNQWFGRSTRRRLEGEVIRDSLLAVSGELNAEAGGPSVRPPLPPELVDTLLKRQWEVSERKADHARRSVFVFARRNLRYPIFEAFDRPDAGASCARRDRSTTAIQSLLMLNSDLTFRSAVRLRDRLLREFADSAGPYRPEELITRLFVITLGRRPSGEETARLVDVFTGGDEHADENPDQTRGERLLWVCLAVLNSNEFVYVD